MSGDDEIYGSVEPADQARPRGEEFLVALRLTRPREAPGTPPGRFAVLPVRHPRGYAIYAIYDRVLSRVVDGMYAEAAMALEVARHYERQGQCPGDRAPNAAALGLLFADHWWTPLDRVQGRP
jgi:hypothetical protein